MKKHSARFELHSADRVFSVAYTNVAGYNCGYTITTPNGSTIRRIVERDEFRCNLVTNCATHFNSALVDSNLYAFDALSRPTTRRTGTTDVSSVDAYFAYNNRSEVVSSAIGTNIFSHAYDSIGNHVLFSDNLTTNTFAHNQVNQMVGRVVLNAPSTVFAYTFDGGLSSDGDWDYAYNAEDQLVSVTSSSLTNGAVRVFNSYDYRHRRISKTVQRLSVTTAPPPSPPIEIYEWNTIEYSMFVYDDWNLIHETVAVIDGGTTNVSEVQFFWGLDLSGSFQGAGGVGGLLAVSCSGQFYFPTFDNNGNVTKYIDESGIVVAAYEYDDFGRTISQSGSLADFFRHRFSTKYYEDETELYYYGYRFYAPVWHTWLNRDPLGEEGGDNLCVICRNNLVIHFDPLGLEVKIIKHLPGDVPLVGWTKHGVAAETHFHASVPSVNQIPGERGKIRYKVTLTPPRSMLDVYFVWGLSADAILTAMMSEQQHIDSFVGYDRAIHHFKAVVEQIHDCPIEAKKALDKQWKWLLQKKEECIYYNKVYIDGPGGVHGH